MRVVLTKDPLRRILQGAQYLLLAAGVTLLGYCGFALLDAWTFQKQQGRGFERQAHGQLARTVEPSRIEPLAALEDSPPATSGAPVGRIEIERLGLSAVVAEGIGKHTLRRAAGHIPGTALPGQRGNVGIAGHRDTFFRPLEGIRVDDIITVTTRKNVYRYRVVSSRIVGPDEVSVLDPTATEVLTLVTCHPFRFIGPAPNRFIVRAERL